MNNIKQQIKDIIKTDDFGQYLPEFLYHATFSGTLDSIKNNGLGSFKSGYKSLWNLQYEQGVYLDTDASSAESFVEGSDDDRLDTESVVVFKIPTAKLDHSLLEVDWNNTWNTDIIEDGEFESLKDYFDSITYFYGGVIPFADLAMVESLNEDIDHEEVYDSLTFSNEPDKGPIFISDDGMFVNIGKLSFHSKIFNGKDYEADDYYFLNDEYDLIKANGGNRFEPFAYIDLWKTPNPAQKKAIISWMYYLIEWGMYTLQVNTSSSNETHNLTNKIPEDIYDEITRGLLESKNEDVGYRNDDYFGDGKRSLLKVVVHETTELGNIDIPDTVLSTFKHTEEQGKLLKEFIELIDSGNPIEDFDVYIETLMDVIHGEYPKAKYALWLCKTKDDVKKLYGGTDSNIGTYKIEYPKPISDLGEEGLLYVFSKVPTLING